MASPACPLNFAPRPLVFTSLRVNANAGKVHAVERARGLRDADGMKIEILADAQNDSEIN